MTEQVALLPLRSRTLNALLNGGFRSTADVLVAPPEKLLTLRGFGLVSLADLRQVLGSYGVAWGDDVAGVAA